MFPQALLILKAMTGLTGEGGAGGTAARTAHLQDIRGDRHRLAIALFAPNTQQIVRLIEPWMLGEAAGPTWRFGSRIAFPLSPTVALGLLMGAIAFVAGRPHEPCDRIHLLPVLTAQHATQNRRPLPCVSCRDFAVLFFAGVVASHFLFRQIAPQFTGNLSFDQKLLFLRTERS